MIVFDTVMNIIESALVCFALYNYLKLKFIDFKLFLLFIIISIEITIAALAGVEDPVTIIVVISMSLYIKNKKGVLLFVDILFCTTIILTVSISNLLSVMLTSWLYQIHINEIKAVTDAFIVTVIVSKVLFFIAIILMNILHFQKSLSLQLYRWWLLIVIFFLISVNIGILVHLILLNQINIHSMIYTIISLLMIGILFLFLFRNIEIENKEKLELVRESEKNIYREKNYRMVNVLSTQISDAEHRIMYILLQVKNLVLDNKQDEAIFVINEYVTKVQRFASVVNTNNVYFDFIINRKINDLLSKDIIVKNNIFISYNDFFDNKNIVEYICEAMDIMTNSLGGANTITVDIQQDNEILICNLSCKQKAKQAIKLTDNFIRLVEDLEVQYVSKEIEDIVIIKSIIDIK